jgi:hypothetical protein
MKRYSIAAVAMPLCAALLFAAMTATAVEATSADQPQGGPGSLTGVWFNAKFSSYHDDNLPQELPRARMTADGQPPPYQPWARAEVERRLQSFKDRRPVAKLSASCIPGGTPQMMQPAPQLPIEIVETPGQVTVLFESMTTFRIIRMNESHPADPDPTFFGNSVGHWEGDTLVVDTIALKEVTTIDDVVPHSEALHVTERLHRTGPGSMEILETIDDPKVFTRPYTYRFSFKRVPGQRLKEFICENNRNAPDAEGRTTAQLGTAVNQN